MFAIVQNNTIEQLVQPNTQFTVNGITYAAQINVLSNGFNLVGTASGGNSSGATYIYAAFASNPFAYSNAF